MWQPKKKKLQAKTTMIDLTRTSEAFSIYRLYYEFFKCNSIHFFHSNYKILHLLLQQPSSSTFRFCRHLYRIQHLALGMYVYHQHLKQIMNVIISGTLVQQRLTQLSYSCCMLLGIHVLLYTYTLQLMWKLCKRIKTMYRVSRAVVTSVMLTDSLITQ